jgi:hypothetical protein
MGETRNTKFGSGKLKGEDNFQDVTAEWRIILKCILKKEGAGIT